MIPQARPPRSMRMKYLPPIIEGRTESESIADHIHNEESWYNRNQLSAGNNPVHLYKDASGAFAIVYGPKCKNLKRARKSVLIYFKLLGQIPGAQVWRDDKDGRLLARIPVPEAEFTTIPLYPIEGY